MIDSQHYVPLKEDITDVAEKMQWVVDNDEEAQRIAMEAHSKGKSLCYKGSMEECETVWEKMSLEGLTVSLVS